jgi:hypothetical protein
VLINVTVILLVLLAISVPVAAALGILSLVMADI